MKEQMLYRDLAKYYDLIYHWKDYKKEVEKIKRMISKYKKSDSNDLLEVGCGTGQHLLYLKDDFSCIGVDINEEMLKVAKKNVKGVDFRKQDMISLYMGKKFDVIISLFGSIGYVKTYENLEKTIQNFSNHLKPDGVVIIDSWLTKSDYIIGFPHMTTYDGEDIKIARLNVSKMRDNLSVIEFHFLIAERNKDVKYLKDLHELGLFEVDKTIEIMNNANLKSKHLKRGLMEHTHLYIGIKK